MENLIEAIKNAIAPNAADEARALGAQACRTVLVALETPAGEPLKAPTVPNASPTDTSPLQMVATALRTLPPDQLLDLAITRLKAALPAGTETAPAQRLLVPLVPVAPIRGGQS
jgi:hypothetical protein